MPTSPTAWSLPSARPARPSDLSHPAVIKLPWIIRAALFLFIFLIPLETLGHDAETTSLTISRLAGVFLVAACLLRPRLLLRPPDRLTLFGFGLMTFALIRTAFLAPDQVAMAGGRYLTWLQMLLFYHLARPLLAAPALRMGTLYAYIAGAAVTALLLLLGAGLNESMVDKGRASLGNLDPNIQSAVLGLAAVWLISLLLHQPFSPKRLWPLLGWPAFLLLVSASLLTGSRGGLIALLAALVAVMFTAGGQRHPMRAAGLVALGAALIVLVAAQDERLVERLQNSVELGDTAGRDYIFTSSLDLWMRRPVLGWGLGANEVELGAYTNTMLRDMHSIYLYALTAGGIAGGVLLGGLLGVSVSSARRLPPGLFRQVSVAGLVFVLIFGGTVTILFLKLFWVTLALSAPLCGLLRTTPTPTLRTA